MKFVADLHIHSRYSMASSKDADLENYYQWAVYKGINVLGTGDFTHPEWRKELKKKLEPAEEGLYRLNKDYCFNDFSRILKGFPVRFMVSGEISTIYKKGGKVRKSHHLILLPTIEAAEKISKRLESIGNIHSDGRPILGLDSKHLLELTLEVCPEALFIPAHIWTPHFSVLGAKTGFDSIEECFEELTDYIYALETGLSSDPPMNWRLSSLDRFILVSNSDAHSPGKLAREANLFDTDLSYFAIREALKKRDASFLGTLEFFPQEGKYHYDGHRKCQLSWKPSETRSAGGVCPVCGRKVTIGVLHRVETLADREEGVYPEIARYFESLIPLPEIIASVLGVGAGSKKVMQHYFSLISQLGPELKVLRETPLEQIARIGGALVARAVGRMRAGEVELQPGFDGEYGKIILIRPEDKKNIPQQAVLFKDTLSEDKLNSTKTETVNVEQPVLIRSISEGQNYNNFGEAVVTTTRLSESEDISRIKPANRVKNQVITSNCCQKILSNLNPEQHKVVTAQQGPVVVLAGPGTGKTLTLVHRIAYLISECGVLPRQITAVTFTNKAALEIRQRVAALLKDFKGIEELNIGTFHSLCLALLYKYKEINNPESNKLSPNRTAKKQLIILDDLDAREVLEEVIVDRRKKTRSNLQKIQKQISLLKSRGNTFSSPEVPGEIRSFYQAYQERLAKYQALDYDDILLETVDLFTRHRDSVKSGKEKIIASEDLSRFSHLLVDEFQDVNPVQYKLTRLWAGGGKNLFVIGDPDQAIYSFRGAEHRFFWQLKEDFAETKYYWLSLNYRSTPAILQAASKVINNNAKAEGIQIEYRKLEAVQRGDSPIIHWEVPGEIAEGIAIVRKIGQLVGGTSMLQAHGQGSRSLLEEEPKEGESRSFSDIAVLFRTSRQGEVLEECFLKEGIPYRMVGRESFLEEPPVRDAIAFLCCLNNPEDDFHLLRCLKQDKHNLDKEEIFQLQDMANQYGCSVWRVINTLVEGRLISKIVNTDKLLAFKNIIDNYQSLNNTPEHLLSKWAKDNNLEEHAGIQRLLRVTSRFADVSSFLTGVVLAAEADNERMGNQVASPEVVTLMTLHAAKGLEFPVVFITGLEEGNLPLKMKSKIEDNLEEERRLFYVGMTRAKEMLVLSSSNKRKSSNGSKVLQPSSFLFEIPLEYLNKVKVKQSLRKKNIEIEFKQLSLF